MRASRSRSRERAPAGRVAASFEVLENIAPRAWRPFLDALLDISPAQLPDDLPDTAVQVAALAPTPHLYPLSRGAVAQYAKAQRSV